MLKYGDVVDFTFSGRPCRAMVVVVDPGVLVTTDEGTGTVDGKGIIVFGFVGPEPVGRSYHQAGETAKLDPMLDAYEVIG